MRERYVLLGLAPARAEWFRIVGQWAAAAVLPAEFIRCVSVEELRARLRSQRAFSAVLVDAGLPGLDRDLIATATELGCAVLVVEAANTGRDWLGLGAAGTLHPPFGRDELLEVLAATARPIRDASLPVRDTDPAAAPPTRGTLVTVTGPGGTGASVTAIALAQGLAAGEGQAPRPRRERRGRTASASEPGTDPGPDPSPGAGPPARVLLADLCRNADQAMLHDSRVLVPGLQELVEAHRGGSPTRATVLDQTFEVADRGYRLLLGLRRSHHWVALRAHALEATLDALQYSVDVVVADVEADLEGEAETGSIDVEERHLLARAAVARSAAVVVVGEASTKGTHALVRTIRDVVGAGVPASRVLPVFARSSRRPRVRAEQTAALASLAASASRVSVSALPSAIHLPARPVDAALRDGVALPAPLPARLARAVTAVIERAGQPAAAAPPEPERVVPGSLGLLTDLTDLDDPDDPAGEEQAS